MRRIKHFRLFPFAASMAAIGVSAGVLATARPQLTATVLVGLPAVILLLTSPTRFASLMTVVVLAPMVPFVKALTGNPLAPVVLDIAMIGLTLVAAIELANSKYVRLDWPVISVVCLLALGLLQMLNPSGPGLLIAGYGYRFFLLPLTGYLVSRHLITTPGRLRWFHRLVLLSAAIVAAYGLHQYFGLNNYDHAIIDSTVGDPTTYTSLGAQRVFSTTSSPTHLAYFMTAAALLVIARTVTGAAGRSQLLLLPLFAAVLLFTIIRTGWYGFAGGLIALLLALGLSKHLSWRSIRWTIGIILAVAAAAVTVANFAASQTAVGLRLDSLLNPTGEPHYVDRVASWITTILPAIARQPWGYGTGSDSTAFGSAFYAHNGYLYVAVELGLLGLILVVSFLVWSLFDSVIWLRRETRPIVASSLLWAVALLCATLVEGFFGALIEVYPVNLYLWIALGANHALTKDPAAMLAPRDLRTQESLTSTPLPSRLLPR